MKIPKIDFAVGGQAVLEGVMMRSPNFYSVSVRNPAGEICFKQVPFVSVTKKFRFLDLPLLRGLIHLFESMTIGFKALSFSNSVYLGEEDEKKPERGSFMKVVFALLSGLYVLATLAFTIFMLKVLPLFIAQEVAKFWSLARDNYMVFNAIDGLTKISIFLGYIMLISLLPDIKRVFEYHGAEHKSIFAYEKGLDLNPENALKQSRFHPRCGTSFIFIVILMSVFIYTLFPKQETFIANLLLRLAVIPLVAGLSYELLKLGARFEKNFVVKVLIAPGLFIQKLTTREPNKEQIEVALNSLIKSLEAEQQLK